MDKESYVREGWVGYRVVTRQQRDPRPVSVENTTNSLVGGMQAQSAYPPDPPYNLNNYGWVGPFQVVSETLTRWVVQDDMGKECLLDKDTWIFLSVGDEKA